ncbi:MBL fold metallo-hydrolase [Halalkalibacter lacteus]|uniref:MBL fold metallo-hydrolase n=1 Tax=Halalkalibacter lacteus TaxID=3090663 RepID=UPI002FCCA64E
MKWVKITDQCSYFSASVNIGYIESNGKGLLIDAGIDDQAAKKVLKTLMEENKPITSLFLTHAHSDHFGGAAFLQKKVPHVKTYAPSFEEAIMRNPRLEPIYLFQGNEPIASLRNKFLEGPTVDIDEVCDEGKMNIGGLDVMLHSFPGHSYNQLGLEYDDILYAADSYFSVETLIKHRIPFQVDALSTKQSLEKLLTLHVKGAVPGHGEYDEQFQTTVDENIRLHEEILQDIVHCLESEGGTMSQDDLLQRMFQKKNIKLNQLSAYLLYRTAVLAFVSELVKKEILEFCIIDYKIYLTQK